MEFNVISQVRNNLCSNPCFFEQINPTRIKIAFFAAVFFAAVATLFWTITSYFNLKSKNIQNNVNFSFATMDRDLPSRSICFETEMKRLENEDQDYLEDIGLDTPEKIIDYCKLNGQKLETFKLGASTQPTPQQYKEIFALAPNIKRVSLRYHRIPFAELKSLKSLEILDIEGMDKNSFQDMAHLADFKSLKYLNLKNTSASISNEHLEPLAQLKSLQFLNLEGNYLVDEEGIQHLSNLNSLQFLNLRSCMMTDTGLSHFKNLRSLHTLILPSSKNQKIITHQGVTHLSSCSSLQNLTLEIMGSDSEQAIEKLAKLTSLRNLNLSIHTIQGKSLDCFSELSSLESLTIRCNVYKGNVIQLSNLPCLKSLDLTNFFVTNQDLERISQLSSLKSLKLYAGCKFDDEGIKELAKLEYLEHLNLSQCNMTVEGLGDLFSHLKSLKTLCLTGDFSKINEQAFEDLKSLYPNVEFFFS